MIIKYLLPVKVVAVVVLVLSAAIVIAARSNSSRSSSTSRNGSDNNTHDVSNKDFCQRKGQNTNIKKPKHKY